MENKKEKNLNNGVSQEKRAGGQETSNLIKSIRKKIENVENPETEIHTINFKTANYEKLKEFSKASNVSISKMINYILEELLFNEEE